MNIRDFHPLRDYATVKRWSTERGLPPAPLKVLPRHGMVVEREGQLLAAAWLYVYEGVEMGRIEMLITDAQVDFDTRGEAIGLVLKGLSERARTLELKLLHAGSMHPRVIEHLQKLGFINMDSNITNLCLSLGDI